MRTTLVFRSLVRVRVLARKVFLNSRASFSFRVKALSYGLLAICRSFSLY